MLQMTKLDSSWTFTSNNNLCTTKFEKLKAPKSFSWLGLKEENKDKKKKRSRVLIQMLLDAVRINLVSLTTRHLLRDISLSTKTGFLNGLPQDSPLPSLPSPQIANTRCWLTSLVPILLKTCTLVIWDQPLSVTQFVESLSLWVTMF